MKKILFAAVIGTLAGSASASVTTYTDRAAFMAALASPGVTSTFEGVPAGDLQNLGSTYNFGSVTATGSTLYLIDGNFFAGSHSTGDGDNLHNESEGGTTTFTIAGGTTAFGVDLGLYFDNGMSIAVTSALGNFTAAGTTTPQTSKFFGLISTTAFTSIGFSAAQNFLQFDNLTIGAAAEVPEPAMLGLFGLGAIGLGLSRRRRA